MMIGLVGRKCGMSRVFTEEGESIPVTVVEVLPNRITQIKTLEKDGYEAIQVTVGEKKRSRLNKAEAGHFAKANVEPGVYLHEFRITQEENSKADMNFVAGAELTVALFQEGQYVDVSGTTKGKGFAGTIKRWNFASQDMTHGNSVSHRAPGSIGQRQTPGRVYPGKKMSGQLGNVACTVLSLKVVRVDSERNFVLIRGAIPGAPKGYVIIRHAIKKSANA